MSNINLIQVQITQLHYIKLKLGKFNIKFLTKIYFNTNTNICYCILLQSNWSKGYHCTNVIRRIPSRRNIRSRPVNEHDSRTVVDSAIAGTLGAGISMHLRYTSTASTARTYSQPFLPDIGDPRIYILQSRVNFSLRNKTLIIVSDQVIETCRSMHDVLRDAITCLEFWSVTYFQENIYVRIK